MYVYKWSRYGMGRVLELAICLPCDLATVMSTEGLNKQKISSKIQTEIPLSNEGRV